MEVPTELMIAIVTSSMACISAVVSAWLSNKSAKSQEKAAKDAKDYRSQREKLDKAKAGVLIATMEGVSVLLRQAKGEKLNGNVEAALTNLDAAEGELNDVRNEIMAQL